MSATRVHRLAVLALVAGGLALVSPPRHAPAEDGPRATVLFDSLIVGPTLFSPDGNGRRDSVAVRFFLAESALVHVYVSPETTRDTVRVLVTSRIAKPDTTYEAEWRGEDQTGNIQPDGIYTIHFLGASIPDGRTLDNQRQVRIDRTPPSPVILAVEPRRYAPTLPDSIQPTPAIRVRVTRSMVEDRLGVAVLDPEGAPQDTLNPVGGFSGDGDYVFACESCDILGDGFHRLRAFGRDAAGNDSTAVDSLDVNADGPDFTVSHPLPPRAQQQADSLVGVAEDRHVVLSVSARIGTPPDTMTVALPPRDGAPAPTYRWLLDVRTLFAAEGAYHVQLVGVDVDGVRSTTDITVTVDRTPPPRPVLDPPLPSVSKTPVLKGTVVVDTDQTSRLVLSGGTQPPDTVAVSPSRPRITFSRNLAVGPNQLSFRGLDRAGNASALLTASVVWDGGAGVVAPERFAAGNAIEVSAGAAPAQAVFIRILALDGSLVRTFADNTAKTYYQFPWDLRTPEGRQVKNGAYLVLARVRLAGGTEELHRTMIAVVR